MKFKVDSVSTNLVNLFLVVELCKVWMLENAQNIDSFGRIEFQRFLDQVHAVAINVRKVIGFMRFLSCIYQVKVLFVDVDF